MSEDIQIKRFISPEVTHEDKELTSEPGLRPQAFSEYPGQERVKANLEVYVKAAKLRKQTLDHVLLHGPPGLGKTTLAKIIALELQVPFIATSGPSIERAGDLAGILSGLENGGLLFIDEIHRLSIQVEEVLYSAMEDFCIDVVIGQGAGARSVKIPVNNFTLVGATTRLSLLSRPLVNRFGIQERLEYYSLEALHAIVERSAKILGIPLDQEGAIEVASRSRGTPRIANRLLKRIWDFTQVEGALGITKPIADRALKRQEIDKMGLDKIDRSILSVIAERYEGGPVGLDTLAATLGEEKTTLEEVFEPFLVHQGLLARGPRGRFLTRQGREYLQLPGN